MSPHPYQGLPGTAFWRKAVAEPDPAAINPAIAMPFGLTAADKIVTAGSCFAQHIGPFLQAIQFNFLNLEPAHPIFPAALAQSFQYGPFSARYGNIYTPRQLLQLWQRAYGEFTPAEDVWVENGTWIDPFRPQIQPGGFLSHREFEQDRAQHFAAVRAAFEAMDVFVFTLGLTESWRSRRDGAVFPLCPGVAGGEFNAERHEFHNFSAAEVEADLRACIAALRRKNPHCRVILTVSPVPLVATARAGTHVLRATSSSKAKLLVAAERVAEACSRVAYFPAYEIVKDRFDGGTYYDADRRTVTGAGVAHVMRCFAESFAGATVPPPPSAAAPSQTQARLQRMELLMKLHCDELALDPGI